MRTILKLTITLAFLLIGGKALAQTEGSNVFVPISKYLAQGNAEKLSAWFADDLEISVLSSSSNSSKNQAKLILKSFFENYTPRSFEITHTAGKTNMKYALGNLSAGGETFRVTVFVSYNSETYKIQQLKIERTQ